MLVNTSKQLFNNFRYLHFYFNFFFFLLLSIINQWNAVTTLNPEIPAICLSTKTIQHFQITRDLLINIQFHFIKPE